MLSKLAARAEHAGDGASGGGGQSVLQIRWVDGPSTGWPTLHNGEFVRLLGGATPLYIAAEKRHCEVVAALLKAGCDMDKARLPAISPGYHAAGRPRCARGCRGRFGPRPWV